MQNFIHKLTNINRYKTSAYCEQCKNKVKLKKYKVRGKDGFNYRCENRPLWKDRHKTWGSQKYIYLIKMKNNDNFIKIGAANNIQQRMKFLQTCSPYELEVIFNQQVLAAHQIEKSLHTQFQDKRIKGEWFSLTEQDINLIKEAIQEFSTRYSKFSWGKLVG